MRMLTVVGTSAYYCNWSEWCRTDNIYKGVRMFSTKTSRDVGMVPLIK